MTDSRDSEFWAPNVERLRADGGLNVGGRRLAGPQQGFGPMWQKTYLVHIPGIAPEAAITAWKENYGSFWPAHSRFNAPVAGIKPGEVGNIRAMQILSTGVMVLYADATSFAFMTPEGHPFAGWITFSAYEDPETVAQVELLIRPSDPLWDLAFVLGAGKGEDLMWQHTLRSLAAHFGFADASTDARLVKVDRSRLWKNARNIRRNAAIGSIAALATSPVRLKRRPIDSTETGG